MLQPSPVNIEHSIFGKTPDGHSVESFKLTSADSLTLKLISLGASVAEFYVPDRQGKSANVVLGFSDLETYLESRSYFGCIVGRVANRIGGAQFTHGGRNWKLSANEKNKTLHGGFLGLSRRVWNGRTIESPLGPAVEFSYLSPHLEEGFPGNLQVNVIYQLLPAKTLRITMRAATDQPTPVNMTAHNYFNLRGAGRGDILGHELFIDADRYTHVDEMLVATGQIHPVAGTPWDFSTSMRIGARMATLPAGYDLNYVLCPRPGGLRRAAVLKEQESGRVLEVHTTQPAIQFYSGYYLDRVRGNGGAYGPYSGLALEPQHFPNSVNLAHFPDIIIHPDRDYEQIIEYRWMTA
ncbi:MAG TPA: aldose epimerase family protein [Phycisphaerae bacterium]|nr:aldose epimerase family protein [Phycisphaerae bacterium]